MDKVIEYGSIEAIPLYNCSEMTADEWTERHGVKRPYIGSISISFGVIAEILFIPCLLCMLEKDLYRMSCYKIMLAIGINDVFAIAMNSILTGYLALEGAVFCSHPTLIYIAGVCGLGMWSFSCFANIVLLINRIGNLKKSMFCEMIFEGNRTYIFLLAPLLHGFCMGFFTTACLFTSKYYAWFYDPLIFPNRSHEYSNLPHGVNNILVMVVTLSLYVYICYTLKKKSYDSHEHRTQSVSNRILYQSIVICAFNQIAAAVYLVMNLVPVPEWLIVAGQFNWQLDHASPVLVYLTMNPTMRERFLKKVSRKNFSKLLSVRVVSSRPSIITN